MIETDEKRRWKNTHTQSHSHSHQRHHHHHRQLPWNLNHSVRIPHSHFKWMYCFQFAYCAKSVYTTIPCWVLQSQYFQLIIQFTYLIDIYGIVKSLDIISSKQHIRIDFFSFKLYWSGWGKKRSKWLVWIDSILFPYSQQKLDIKINLTEQLFCCTHAYE